MAKRKGRPQTSDSGMTLATFTINRELWHRFIAASDETAAERLRKHVTMDVLRHDLNEQVNRVFAAPTLPDDGCTETLPKSSEP